MLNIYLPAGDKVPGNYIAQEAIQLARDTGEGQLEPARRIPTRLPDSWLKALFGPWTVISSFGGALTGARDTWPRILASPRLLVEILLVEILLNVVLPPSSACCTGTLRLLFGLAVQVAGNVVVAHNLRQVPENTSQRSEVTGKFLP